MTEKIIKSVDRVKDIGEVFTPQKTVDFMLDQPEIKEKVNSLTATFLEPSAGEGAFLVEILRRKMEYAKSQSKTNEKIYTGRTETNKVVNFEGNDGMLGKILPLQIISEHMWYLKGKQIM